VLRPDNDSWAAAISDSDPGAQRLGTAVVIDGYRLLPCLHVVGDRDRVRVAFPEAAGLVDRRASWSDHCVAGVERAPGAAVRAAQHFGEHGVSRRRLGRGPSDVPGRRSQ
jgi:hypothetical protein